MKRIAFVYSLIFSILHNAGTLQLLYHITEFLPDSVIWFYVVLFVIFIFIHIIITQRFKNKYTRIDYGVWVAVYLLFFSVVSAPVILVPLSIIVGNGWSALISALGALGLFAIQSIMIFIILTITVIDRIIYRSLYNPQKDINPLDEKEIP